MNVWAEVGNSRIAKNTVYLYIRMIFVLGANFFAVRAADITKDVDSERTPRGAMFEDLNAAPFQSQASFQEGRFAYCVSGVNRPIWDLLAVREGSLQAPHTEIG